MFNRAPSVRAIVVTLAVSLIAGAGPAGATALGLTFGSPEIQATAVQLGYDEVGGELMLEGSVTLITFANLTTESVLGDFDLTAMVDPLGVFSGGTFTMFDGTTLLLAGDLTAFASSPSSIEFLYNVTGGSIGAGYTVGGITLSGGFQSDRLSSLSAVARPVISSPVPEPSAGLLFLIGAATIAAHGPRRR